MAIRPIRLFGDPILRQKAAPVVDFDKELRDLVRDLTDTMYNPRMRPQVPHDRGTDLVVEHVEKNWCPSTTSGQLLQSKRSDSPAN